MQCVTSAKKLRLSREREIELFTSKGKLVLVRVAGKGWSPANAMDVILRAKVSHTGRLILAREFRAYFAQHAKEAARAFDWGDDL